jgi:hypothetical protein
MLHGVHACRILCNTIVRSIPSAIKKGWVDTTGRPFNSAANGMTSTCCLSSLDVFMGKTATKMPYRQPTSFCIGTQPTPAAAATFLSVRSMAGQCMRYFGCSEGVLRCRSHCAIQCQHYTPPDGTCTQRAREHMLYGVLSG